MSKKRQRESTTTDRIRNDFDKDYDRVIPSSSLRRLQNKTQVYPLQENDIVRTRLTHSIEVSAIARSIGLLVGERLYEENKVTCEEIKYELSSLLATAGLVHDLGNPPFGHYGEAIIRAWFKEWFDKIEKEGSEEEKQIIESMKVNEKYDFLLFEGNAQTLRILSKLQFLNDQYGMNLTYGTLAALIKYPWDSVHAKKSEEDKLGFFDSERNLIISVERHLQKKRGVA